MESRAYVKIRKEAVRKRQLVSVGGLIIVGLKSVLSHLMSSDVLVKCHQPAQVPGQSKDRKEGVGAPYRGEHTQ